MKKMQPLEPGRDNEKFKQRADVHTPAFRVASLGERLMRLLQSSRNRTPPQIPALEYEFSPEDQKRWKRAQRKRLTSKKSHPSSRKLVTT